MSNAFRLSLTIQMIINAAAKRFTNGMIDENTYSPSAVIVKSSFANQVHAIITTKHTALIVRYSSILFNSEVI
jgi:hypothetical protein